jgi:signal peptidase II
LKRFTVWALAVFLLDRITKMAVQTNMVEGETIPVIQGIFHITYYRNPGAAFSLLAHKTEFFIVIGLIVMGTILYYYRWLPADKSHARIAMALLFGGVAGNMVDRIFGGYVVDFFDFMVWPVFNVADSAIVIGVLFLSWQILTWPEENKEGQEN